MASLRKEIQLTRDAEDMWAAIRDVGAVHERLARDFVVDTTVDHQSSARVVTFANGPVVRELMVDVDDERRRIAYCAVDGPLEMTDQGVIAIRRTLDGIGVG